MITCSFEDGNPAKLRHVTVDCIVIQNNKILLGKRNGKLQEGGKWCLLGGFMDRDENLAGAAAREIMEESGWCVADLRLLRIKDYPDRPHEGGRQNVSFVFVATALEQTGTHDWESDEIRWFELDNLPEKGSVAFDHYEDIELYKAYLEQPFALPLIGRHQTN